MAMPDTHEIGRRIRAARAYVEIDQPALAEYIGISVPTLINIEKGRRPARRGEILAVAERCELPTGFFYRDWKDLGEYMPE